MNPLNYIRKSPHRNHLEKYLVDFLPKLECPIIDIGSKNRRYDHLLKEKPVAVDLVENNDFIIRKGDIMDLKFSDKSFKSVVSIEVLEYVSDFRKAVGEVSRVLRDNGEFIFSVPFMYGVHQDKLRYTKQYLLEEVGKYFLNVEVYLIGNFYTIVLDILRGKIMKVKFLPLRYLCYIPYTLLVLLVPLSKFSQDENYVSGYFVVAKK